MCQPATTRDKYRHSDRLCYICFAPAFTKKYSLVNNSVLGATGRQVLRTALPGQQTLLRLSIASLASFQLLLSQCIGQRASLRTLGDLICGVRWVCDQLYNSSELAKGSLIVTMHRKLCGVATAGI